jgi:hypothetical protein
MFEPIPHTAILEKSGRLIGGKPKGRLTPREGGDTLGAHINNELLLYQWDDNTRLGKSMIAKWIEMDQGTRKYGKKFGLCKWRYEKRGGEVFYDGPDFISLRSRDCLPNPSYEQVKNWFQYREYVTLKELEKVNDLAQSEDAKYKNLDLLRDALKEDGKGKGDSRSIQTRSINKTIRGLTDYLGMDEVFKVVEIVTEYRNDRWITFCPKHGVVIRDIKNPYKHGEIPIVELAYYQDEDDLYGTPELEPVSKQIKGLNAHLSAFSDTVSLALRPPIHVNPVNVRMHTLDWSPEAKWLMNNPNQDVQVMKVDTSAIANFQTIYQTLRGSLMNALGEQGQGVSAINPTQDNNRVTATEIKDTGFTRNVRDNMNQIFLAEALKKQIMFWHSMNQQFLFKGVKDQQRIIRIVGRDAAEFFMRNGLSDIRPTEEDGQKMAMGQLQPSDIMPGPRFPVQVGEDEMGAPMEVPKFIPDETGEGGNLIVEPGDLSGNYDYIPDIESMKAPSTQDVKNELMQVVAMILNPTVIQLLAQEGKKPKVQEILTRAFEATNTIKDAEALFEDIQEGGVLNGGQVVPPGVATPEGGLPAQGGMPTPGMEGGLTPPSGGGGQIGSSGPAQVQL